MGRFDMGHDIYCHKKKKNGGLVYICIREGETECVIWYN